MAAHLQTAVLHENIKLPPAWERSPEKATTRTELKKLQREEFVPDLSYDIDGDGSIGNRDYVS